MVGFLVGVPVNYQPIGPSPILRNWRGTVDVSGQPAWQSGGRRRIRAVEVVFTSEVSCLVLFGKTSFSGKQEVPHLFKADVLTFCHVLVHLSWPQKVNGPVPD